MTPNCEGADHPGNALPVKIAASLTDKYAPGGVKRRVVDVLTRRHSIRWELGVLAEFTKKRITHTCDST